MVRSVAATMMLGAGVLAVMAAAPAVAADPTGSPGPSMVPVATRLQATIPVEGSPDWPVVAFGSVWVLAPDLPLHGVGTPMLVRIDPATNTVVSTIELPDRLCQGIVATDDAIWACAKDALVRVDPTTDAITDLVPVKGATGGYRLAWGDGSVWSFGSTTFNADTVVRLDPATGTVTTYPLPATAGGMAYAFDALWVTIPDQGLVSRLDPATGDLTPVIAGPTGVAQIVAGEADLWVSLYGEPLSMYPSDGAAVAVAGDPQVARVATDGTLRALIPIGASGRGGVDLAADGPDVLVRNTSPWLARIDGATNAVVDQVTSEPDIDPIQGPLALGFDSIWTVNIEQNAVYRLAP
ncbi:MAG: hypothetical protein U0869_19760 [Chloroflexota bacterium]